MTSRSSRAYSLHPQEYSGANYWRSASSSSTIMRNMSSSPPRKKHSSCKAVVQCLQSFYNARIITVEPIIFLFMFAYYFYKVIFELYIFNLYGKEAIHQGNEHLNLSNFNRCLSIKDINNFTNYTSDENPGNLVETRLAHLVLIVGVAARIPSALSTLVLGPISDRFGRKPTLLVNLVGMLLNAAVAIVIVLNTTSEYFFILGAGLRGMCGGIAGILTACYSYIADISSRRWLVVRLGLLEAMTFAASTLSLLGAGAWSQMDGCDFSPLVWVVLGCMVVAIPYTLFLLPESLDREEDGEKKSKTAPGSRVLLRGLQIFFGRDYPRCKLWLLLLVMIVTILNTTGTIAIITLFLLHEPIGWTPIHIGGYLALSEMMHGLVLVVVLPLLVYLGIKDSFIAFIGLWLSVGANVSLGFADKTWEIYLIGAMQSVDALILPGLKAVMSKSVRPKDHGALFSFVSATQVLASVLGYGVFVPVYTASLSVNWYHASGLPFLIMAALYGLMMPIMMVVWCLQRRQESPPAPRTPVSPSSPERVASTPISSPPRKIGEQERLIAQVQSELGQDILDRRSFYGSAISLSASTDLERSFISSGSYRSFH